MMMLSRRDLLTSGGALVLVFSLLDPPQRAVAQDAPNLPGSLQDNPMLDSWIGIGADGAVTVFTGKVELGQGIKTALLQVAAEELDIGRDRIRMVTADTARTPNEGYTAASQSMQNSGTAIQYAAAEVRQILLEMAAVELGMAVEMLAVEDGTIRAPGTAQETSYWRLVNGRVLHRTATGKVAPKRPETYAIVGRPFARLDIPGKVTGGVSFVHDLRLPGMLHARVVRPPNYRSPLRSVNTAVVAAIPGIVKIVQDGSFLAVIAEQEGEAIRARDGLMRAAVWDIPSTLPAQANLYALLTTLPSQDTVVKETRAPQAAAAAQTLEAIYYRPYQMHAAIGPSCAVARLDGDALTVWTHSQGVYPLRDAIAEMLRVPRDRVRCIHMEGAGCYGHNGADDVAADAALLARAVPGRPVRVQWMRDDEHAWEPYGSAMVMRARASLDAEGRVSEWVYEVWSTPHSTRPGGAGQLLPAWHLERPFMPSPPRNIPQPAGGGDRNAVPLYRFPNMRVVNHFVPTMPLRVSALRSLGAYGNVFALESFMDELAGTAGLDPVAFRLRHLEDPRARAVVEAAAQRFGWDAFQPGFGRGRGFGFARYKNLAAYTAVAVDAEVNPWTGAVRVVRAVAANDSGQVVNPEGLRQQLEGGIVQSMSWTLKEQVAYDQWRILSRDWIGYPIATFNDVPEIEVVLIDRPGEPYLGTGETAQGPTGAAIANAVANASGRRIRELPLTPARVVQHLYGLVSG